MPLLGLDRYQQAVDAFIESKDKAVRGVLTQGLSNVALGTPVDEGSARNAWILTEGSPSNKVVTSESKAGTASLAQVKRMPKSIFGKKLFYANNTPYIGLLEYGGYPNPTTTKIKDPKTINGFSDQAPDGWVRSEIIRIKKAIRAI